MNYFSSPLVWLRRFRHRCGYGVHSPFAFRFITEVIYEKDPYYAYKQLDSQLPFWYRFRIRKCLHLFFRISNYRQPRTIVAPYVFNFQRKYLSAGCSQAQIVWKYPEGPADMICLQFPDNEALAHIGEKTILVYFHLDRHPEWFRSLPSVVSFDLWDVGIAFFDPQYNKQNYVVNF